jgi:hypothetical protein
VSKLRRGLRPLPRARAPALARQRTSGALARKRKLEVTNTTIYSGTLETRVVYFLPQLSSHKTLKYNLTIKSL